MCKVCPRTPVNYVSGLYTVSVCAVAFPICSEEVFTRKVYSRPSLTYKHTPRGKTMTPVTPRHFFTRKVTRNDAVTPGYRGKRAARIKAE